MGKKEEEHVSAAARPRRATLRAAPRCSAARRRH
jgi:hypothetical protein